MNPGLIVKLRPTGPWRIGPDSGARNRVDAIYHSDSLYSAVTSAMARLGLLDEWLDATSRPQEPAVAPAVCFSSCFPFMDDLAYVVPPRTVWPPASQANSARVRWKSARFVPLDIVQAILAGRKLDENKWTMDGPSECLAPAGSPGPFRTAVRWSAAVDRLTGATERHSTACLEFRPGSGLWTVASFADEAARDRWQEPVKAAFRLLADTGFGGERSRGWGRSEAPQFVEGALPEMILPAIRETARQAAPPAPLVEPLAEKPVEELPHEAEASVPAPSEIAPLVLDAAVVTEAPPEPESASADGQAEAPAPQEEPATEPAAAEASVEAPSEIAPLVVEPAEATEAPPEPESAGADGQAEAPAPQEEPATEPAEAEASIEAPAEIAPLVLESPATTQAPPQPESTIVAALTEESPAEDVQACGAGASACQPEPSTPPVPAAAQAEAPAPPAPPTGFEDARPHWLLSLFTPAPSDAVDWQRGSYAALSRGGRVESPAGSGELKKQIRMVAEGSVLFAIPAPRGWATDVAPDGFAHPVYRAGFAVAVPLPKVS